MQRQENGVTFKGSPMTLLGESLKVGQHAPEFNLHYYCLLYTSDAADDP